VKEYVKPETFEAYRAMGVEMGFRHVASGPLVRSSYRAGEFFARSIVRKEKTISEVQP
jgi:lipoic acid synthetase